MLTSVLKILRFFYAVSIVLSTLGGVAAALLFAIAFAIGGPVAQSLCALAIDLLVLVLTPIAGAAVACGLVIIYIDPRERHSFRVEQEP